MLHYAVRKFMFEPAVTGAPVDALADFESHYDDKSRELQWEFWAKNLTANPTGRVTAIDLVDRNTGELLARLCGDAHPCRNAPLHGGSLSGSTTALLDAAGKAILTNAASIKVTTAGNPTGEISGPLVEVDFEPDIVMKGICCQVVPPPKP